MYRKSSSAWWGKYGKYCEYLQKKLLEIRRSLHWFKELCHIFSYKKIAVSNLQPLPKAGKIDTTYSIFNRNANSVSSSLSCQAGARSPEAANCRARPVRFWRVTLRRTVGCDRQRMGDYQKPRIMTHENNEQQPTRLKTNA